MLLLLAFGAMVMALLPEVVFYLGASPERLWAWCSSVFALYAASFLATWSVLNWRIASNAPEIVHWMAFSRMFAGHVIVLLLLLGVVFSLIDEAAAGTYLLALVWYLVHAAQQFSRMLFIQPRSEDVQPNAS
jgi:hypothetical protein